MTVSDSAIESLFNRSVSSVPTPITIDDEPDNLFTRPPRNPGMVLPTVATTGITCRVCGASVTVPILHPGLLCYSCERNPQRAQEQAYSQWEQAQLRAMEVDEAQPDIGKRVYTRYMNVVEARWFADTAVLGRLLYVLRQPKQDARQRGDSPRMQRLVRSVAAGHDNAAIIASEQARVARGIEGALAKNDGLADLLRAEQRYETARDAVAAVLGL